MKPRILMVVLVFLIVGCAQPAAQTEMPSPEEEVDLTQHIAETDTPLSATETPLPSITSTPTLVNTPPPPTPTPTPAPFGSGIHLNSYYETDAELVYQNVLRSPEGMVVGPDGNLYIADWLSGRVMRLTESGELQRVVQLPSHIEWSVGPRDVAFDDNGVLFVATPDTIYRTMMDGELHMFASGLCCMSKIEFGPDGNLYLANEQTGQIFRIDQSGSRWAVADGFNHPFDVAFDPTGEMYVSEFAGRVLHIRDDGTTTVIAEGIFGGENPLHLAFDSEGNLYAHGNGTLAKFAPNGQNMNLRIDGRDPRFMLGFPKANPGGIAFDNEGNLYIADSPNGKITVLSPDGHLDLLVHGFNPNGIGIGPDGSIYAISSADYPQGPGELWRITLDGERSTIAQFEWAPQIMAIDKQGTVYIVLRSVNQRQVVRVDSNGTVEDILSQSDAYGRLAATAEGLLYVSVPSRGLIYAVSPDASSSVFASGLSQTSEVWAYTLAVAPDGVLYAADGVTGDIIRFSAEGSPESIANIPELVGPPNAFAAGPDGHLFLLAGTNYQLWHILPSGEKRRVAISAFGDPIGMAVSDEGVLFLSRGGSIDRISGLLP